MEVEASSAAGVSVVTSEAGWAGQRALLAQAGWDIGWRRITPCIDREAPGRLFALSNSPPRRKVLGFRHCTSVFFGDTCSGACSSRYSAVRLVFRSRRARSKRQCR